MKINPHHQTVVLVFGPRARYASSLPWIEERLHTLGLSGSGRSRVVHATTPESIQGFSGNVVALLLEWPQKMNPLEWAMQMHALKAEAVYSHRDLWNLLEQGLLEFREDSEL